MPDFFAILHQPRLPALEAEQLKQSFLRLSGEAHPDKFPAIEKAEAEARFAEINVAFNTLRLIRSRLLHLLQLEGSPPAPHVQAVPGEVTPFFTPMADLTHKVDEFLARKQQAESPMLQAQFFAEGLDWTTRIQELQGRLHQEMQKLESELLPMNTRWQNAPPPGDPARPAALPLARLQQIATMLGFFERWNAQLHERLATLAF